MELRDFSYHQFLPEVILQFLIWYLKYPISYHNLEKMITEKRVLEKYFRHAEENTRVRR
jgi:transposase-like protein